MKNYKSIILWLGISALMISCASAPQAPPEMDTGSVAERREEADAARMEAEEVKAAQAAKAEFDMALVSYNGAVTAEGEGDLEAALEGFTQSITEFRTSAATAKQRRAEAENAIKAAEKAISDVEMKAEDAIKAASEEDAS